MANRYDLMLESTQVDSSDNQTFPDPLSFDFGTFVFKEPPYVLEPTDQMATKPYLITYSFYNRAEYDDIVFNINNIPHVSKVFDFETIRYPSNTDLIEFLKKVI
jgi:hypothetical protein